MQRGSGVAEDVDNISLPQSAYTFSQANFHAIDERAIKTKACMILGGEGNTPVPSVFPVGHQGQQLKSTVVELESKIITKEETKQKASSATTALPKKNIHDTRGASPRWDDLRLRLRACLESFMLVGKS